MSYLDKLTNYTEAEVREKINHIMATEGISKTVVASLVKIQYLTLNDFLAIKRSTRKDTFMKLYKFITDIEENGEYLKSLRKLLK